MSICRDIGPTKTFGRDPRVEVPDCNGNAQLVDGARVAINHPVYICPNQIGEIVTAIEEKRDYEPMVFCDELTGNPVILTFTYDNSGFLEITLQNPDGTPFVGNIVRCPGGVDYDLSQVFFFCDSSDQTTVIRRDIFQDGVFVSSVWTDLVGSVIPAPDPGDLVAGACSVSPVELPMSFDFESLTVGIASDTDVIFSFAAPSVQIVNMSSTILQATFTSTAGVEGTQAIAPYGVYDVRVDDSQPLITQVNIENVGSASADVIVNYKL